MFHHKRSVASSSAIETYKQTSLTTDNNASDQLTAFNINVSEPTNVYKKLSHVSKECDHVAHAQRALSKMLTKWAKADDNSAIRDIGQHYAELIRINADKQAILAVEMEKSAQSLRKMSDLDRQIESQLKHIRKLEAAQVKLKKEIERGSNGWFAKGGDIRVSQMRLNEVEKELTSSKSKLEDNRNEQQVVRMFRLRQGLQQMANANREYAIWTDAIYSALGELAECVPQISTQNVNQFVYTATGHTKAIVSTLKQQISANKSDTNKSYQRRRSAPILKEPPPAYSTISLNKSETLNISATSSFHDCPHCCCGSTETLNAANDIYPKLYEVSEVTAEQMPSAPPLE